MQVGSLVELIDDNWNYSDRIVPVKEVIYTVRELPEDRIGILLEEIINKKEYCRFPSGKAGYGEPGFIIKRFRELQPPMKISIDELIQEPLTV